MHIIINNTSMIPIYEQLVEQIKRDIIGGTLQENDGLPSVRSLSSELRISALTVKKAYDKLEEDGFVITVHGKGTYIAPTNHSFAREARFKAAEDEIALAIEKARAMGLDNEEIREIVNIILEV